MARRTLFTDDFNRADNADLGAAWDRYSGVNGLVLGGNSIQAEVGSAALDDIESHNGSLPNDQWASLKILTLQDVTVAYSSFSIGCRWAAPNTLSGYLFLIDSTSGPQFRVSLHTYTSGAFATITGSPSNFVNITLTANDIFLLDVIGTTLTGYQNGTQRITGTDSAFASGRAAIEAFTGGSPAANTADDFASGDFTGGSPPPLVFHPLQA